jgi:hypothetical protein
MNAARGWLRIGIVVSAFWSIAFATLLAWSTLKARQQLPRPYEWIEIGLVATGPWTVMLSVLAVRWIATGFRSVR